MNIDNWNEWEATNEDEWEEEEEENKDEDEEEDKDEDEDEDEDENNKKIVDYQKIKKISPNWHIVPEVINRQIGSNPLFERRFYSSLYAVEQLQLMYKLYPSVSVNYLSCKCYTLNYADLDIILKVSLSYSRIII